MARVSLPAQRDVMCCLVSHGLVPHACMSSQVCDLGGVGVVAAGLRSDKGEIIKSSMSVLQKLSLSVHGQVTSP